MQQFNYHSHTYRCGHADKDMKDEDYVKEYIKMGFQKIAFTDHCPEKNEIDKRPTMRMKYSQKNEYLDSINILKQKYSDKIQIQTGYEVEYLPGEEDNINELKKEVDKIVLGQHFIYDNNKILKIFGKHDFSDEELLRYAEYIEKAMKLNIPDIIAHPDLYMQKRNKFGDIENKVANIICNAAEIYNIPLEVNLNKIFRRTYYENKKFDSLPDNEKKEKINNAEYPCKEFWNVAKNYNIRVLYGIDVHYRGQILLWKELVNLANEIIGEDTINKLNFIDAI